MNIKLHIVILFLPLFLFACGGGSDTQNTPSTNNDTDKTPEPLFDESPENSDTDDLDVIPLDDTVDVLPSQTPETPDSNNQDYSDDVVDGGLQNGDLENDNPVITNPADNDTTQSDEYTNHVAKITDTLTTDTGELRYQLSAPVESGKISLSFLKQASEKDAFITLFGSSTTVSTALIDLRIKSGSFEIRNLDTLVIQQTFVSGEWVNVKISWDTTQATESVAPLFTLTINGNEVGEFSSGSSDLSLVKSGVEYVGMRLGDNLSVLESAYYIDNLAIFSGKEFSGTEYSGTEKQEVLFSDNFENHKAGTSLKIAPYENNNTNEAIVYGLPIDLVNISEILDLDGDGIIGSEDPFPNNLYNYESITVCSRTEDVGTKDHECEEKSFMDYGLGSITDYKITDPSVLLFDRSARKAELATYPQETVDSICTIEKPVDYDRKIEALPEKYYGGEYIHGDDYVYDDAEKERLLDFKEAFTVATADWFVNENEQAVTFMVQNLLLWAETGSLTEIDLAHGRSTFDMKRWSIAVLFAWEAIGNLDLIADADKLVIESYLNTIISRMDYHDYIEQGSSEPTGLDMYNHGWFKDAINMMWGIKTNNDLLFQLGIKRYLRILDGHLRTDGSVIAETQRGSVALHYHTVSVGHAVQLAEIAYQQGYDLYSVSVNGLDIHKAVEYTISAIEDHSLVTQYSQYQLTCTEEQCNNWQVQDFNERSGWNDAAFLEIYIRRFPDSELAKRLRDYFTLPEFNSVYHDTLGSITSCDFRQY
ncbi:alginate lyase family protein [Colwellia sp. E2M01]|uniref:alginate lyase family protein n=1 Tax=Colwellia sp. E2M01 TaxID=2841561 RepID=UPI001C08FD99|nr:alginate lyase family protein [Colwellia sp. E2M01]MBU2870871.1 alginate lyase family protein [Colwellia sp. E2M01]